MVNDLPIRVMFVDGGGQGPVRPDGRERVTLTTPSRPAFGLQGETFPMPALELHALEVRDYGGGVERPPEVLELVVHEGEDTNVLPIVNVALRGRRVRPGAWFELTLDVAGVELCTAAMVVSFLVDDNDELPPEAK